MRLIKSIIANHYYRKTFHFMGISSPVLALDSIQKASKWEPDEKYIPRYLSLQSELELGLGEKNRALDTLLAAKQIIKKYKEFWYSDAQKDFVRRIDNAVNALETSGAS